MLHVHVCIGMIGIRDHLCDARNGRSGRRPRPCVPLKSYEFLITVRDINHDINHLREMVALAAVLHP